jgi:RecJ-like exonuclease
MPIFGIAKREEEKVYKISGRAHESIVNMGVNLSDAIRKALELSNLDALGGGHPPAAGTKIPIEKIDEFLNHCDTVIKSQIQTGKVENNNGF